MSRLNTQTRLNDGPRTLDVPRSFLVNPQRVFSRSTQDIGGCSDSWVGRLYLCRCRLDLDRLKTIKKSLYRP